MSLSLPPVESFGFRGEREREQARVFPPRVQEAKASRAYIGEVATGLRAQESTFPCRCIFPPHCAH